MSQYMRYGERRSLSEWAYIKIWEKISRVLTDSIQTNKDYSEERVPHVRSFPLTLFVFNWSLRWQVPVVLGAITVFHFPVIHRCAQGRSWTQITGPGVCRARVWRQVQTFSRTQLVSIYYLQISNSKWLIPFHSLTLTVDLKWQWLVKRDNSRIFCFSHNQENLFIHSIPDLRCCKLFLLLAN